MNPILLYPMLAVVLLLIGGFYSLLVTRNIVRVLISLEVLMKGVTLALVIAGYATNQMGEIQSYIITMIVLEVVLLCVAAGLVVNIYKKYGTLDVNKISGLKGTGEDA